MVSEPTGSPPEFTRLLDYLKQSRGFDLSCYKRTTLNRRIEKRMLAVGVSGYEEYQDFLEVHQEEFPSLFNTILINVTSFFRDPEAWEYLESHVVPQLLTHQTPKHLLRIWVAGCASGEEACSIAMILAEALGREQFRNLVKIYATDLDEDALNSSRAAGYSESSVAAVPAHLREKYFEKVNDLYVFDRDLRRSLIYGRHNLTQDAPISRVDLLLCRNTLMYFNAEVQDRIIQRFHFALNDGGFLFLGRAETMIAHNDLFSIVDLKNRVFAKAPRGRTRERGFMFTKDLSDAARIDLDGVRLREAAFDVSPWPQIVLDLEGRLVHANERARTLFSIGRKDLGSPIQDLDISFRPVELRSGIEQALVKKRTIRHKDVVWTTQTGEAFTLDVSISMLRSETGDAIGTQILFEDITAVKQLQNELQNFRQELETAYEEVQSTNEELQTTNEELQSTIEELETTNEELQSTNEELETMNEETQSANEELETINEELRLRSNELNRANALMESILSSLRDGVIVLDNELQILAWNSQSEDLWGLRADEVLSKHLLNLDMGLPVDQFRGLIRSCLASREPQVTDVEALNRRGKKINCRVDFTPLIGSFQECRGVIIVTTCG